MLLSLQIDLYSYTLPNFNDDDKMISYNNNNNRYNNYYTNNCVQVTLKTLLNHNLI